MRAGAEPHLSASQLTFIPLLAATQRSLHVRADTLTEAPSSRAAQSAREKLFVQQAVTTAAGDVSRTRVGVAITGSVRAERHDILATMHLNDGATGEEKSTAQFRASPRNLAPLEDRIRVANALGLE